MLRIFIFGTRVEGEAGACVCRLGVECERPLTGPERACGRGRPTAYVLPHARSKAIAALRGSHGWGYDYDV